MQDGLRRLATFPHEVVSAATMPIGARVFAEHAIDAARLGESDRVVDVGCGPGTASRAAARRGATVYGVDPTPVMLTFARWLTPASLRPRVTWLNGLAEAIPLNEGEATVVLAIRSAHHFDDPHSAFGEMRRVLASGGRVVIVERALKPKARSHRHHGFTAESAHELAAELEANGFDEVKTDTRRSRHGEVVVLSAVRP